MRVAGHSNARKFAAASSTKRRDGLQSCSMDHREHAGSNRIFLLPEISVHYEQDAHAALGTGDDVCCPCAARQSAALAIGEFNRLLSIKARRSDAAADGL